MDIQVVQWIISGIMGIALWAIASMYNDMKTKVKEVQDDLKDTKKELAHTKDTYYRREDFREFKEELFERLRSLEQKIDKNKEQ